jgi:ankyrin repeat protein
VTKLAEWIEPLFLAALDDDVEGLLNVRSSTPHVDLARILAAEHLANTDEAVRDRLSIYEGQTVLHTAVSCGSIHFLRAAGVTAVEANAYNVGSETPLALAVDFGNCEITRFFLTLVTRDQAQMFRDERQYTLLHIAANRGNPEITEILLDAGLSPAELDERHRPPFYLCLSPSGGENFGDGHINTMKLLMQHPSWAEVRKTPLRQKLISSTMGRAGCTIGWLHDAAGAGNVLATEALIADGFDVNEAHGEFEPTPLQWACYQYAQSGVQALLDHGADLSCDWNGRSALNLATMSLQGDRCLATVATLLAAGCDPLARDRKGDVPRERASAPSLLALYHAHASRLAMQSVVRNSIAGSKPLTQ